jgi:hypothetical protein
MAPVRASSTTLPLISKPPDYPSARNAAGPLPRPLPVRHARLVFRIAMPVESRRPAKARLARVNLELQASTVKSLDL